MVETVRPDDIDVEEAKILLRGERFGGSVVHVSCVVDYDVEFAAGGIKDVLYACIDGVLGEEIQRNRPDVYLSPFVECRAIVRVHAGVNDVAFFC